MEDFNYGEKDKPYSLKKHSWILGSPEMGERVWIGAFCLVDAYHAAVKIGKGTEISSGAQILTHSTVRRAISERRHGETDYAPVEIGEFCFIGTNATVLMGSKIGHHSVVAAGAVVTQNMVVPPYSIVVGVPAKVTGSSKKFLKEVEKESLSVVIPAYNEKSTIEKVVTEALVHLKKLKVDYEVVLVNDGSIDGTDKIIEKIARKNKRVRVIHHKKNRGFTGAMKTCFRSAHKHFIFLAPADGGFDFSDLGKFREAIKGYDVATAYITRDNEDIVTKIKVAVFHWPFLVLSRFLLGIKLREFSSVSLWRRRVFESFEVESEDKSAMFLPELVSKALAKNYKFVQVQIKWHPRRGGEAKGAKLSVALRTFMAMLRLWFKIRKGEA